jgi:hypothetical protein
MSTPPVDPAKKSNALIITLASIGGVLLLAVVALVFLLIGRGTGSGDPGLTAASDSPSPTPTVSASVEPEPEPEPEDTTPRFTSFDALTEVECPPDGEKPEILVSWETAFAVEVWYTSGHEDAKDDNYMQVPLSGSQADFTDEHLFPCNHRETSEYTLTLVGPNNERVSEFWTVVDLNWNN